MCKSPRVSSVSPTSASTADVPAKEITAPSADDPSAKAPVKTSKPLSCTQLGRMVCRGVLLLALGAAFILTSSTLFQLLGDDDDHDGHDDKDDNDKPGLLVVYTIFLLALGWLLVWFLMCVATIQCLRSPEDVAAGRERIERKLENLVELNFYKRLPQSDRNFMMDKHYIWNVYPLRVPLPQECDESIRGRSTWTCGDACLGGLGRSSRHEGTGQVRVCCDVRQLQSQCAGVRAGTVVGLAFALLKLHTKRQGLKKQELREPAG